MKKLFILCCCLLTWCATLSAQINFDTIAPLKFLSLDYEHETVSTLTISDGATTVIFADDGRQIITLPDGTRTEVQLPCEAYFALTDRLAALIEQWSEANDKVYFYERYFGKVSGDLSGPCVTVLPPPDKPKKCD